MKFSPSEYHHSNPKLHIEIEPWAPRQAYTYKDKLVINSKSYIYIFLKPTVYMQVGREVYMVLALPDEDF